MPRTLLTVFLQCNQNWYRVFCPKCKTEYLSFIKKCADCRATLKNKLEEQPIESIKFTQLAITYSQTDITFLKSLLTSEGVDFFFKGENFLLVRPLVDPVRLMVAEADVAKAKEILEDFKFKLMSF